jgi:outer membrane protein TolC
MKTFILPLLLLLLYEATNSQQRNLNFFLEQAKANSPLIHKSKNENKIADLDLELVKSVLSKPEINLEANVLFAPIVSRDNHSKHMEWISEGATDYTGFDLAATDGGQYQALISLRQSLFTKSLLKDYSNQTENNHRVNENAIALTVHEIEQLVSYQYILCLKSKIQNENSLSVLKVLEEQLGILQKLVENTIYKQTDLMLLQIEYQNYLLENKTNQEEYQNNLYDLDLICGIKDTNFVDIQELNLQLKPDSSAHSKFLTSYELDSIHIRIENHINELKYKPRLDWFVNAGMNAVYQPTLNRLGFNTGLSFTWNLYDGKQRESERKKSVIELETIEYEKKNFMTQNEIYKNKIMNQLNAVEEKLIFIEKQVSQYDQLFNTYQKELSQGEISIMDFKNLVKDIAAKKQEGLLLKMDKQMLINSYNYWNY